MNWPALRLRMRANEIIAADRRARGDVAGARQLEAWNEGFLCACALYCGQPLDAFEHVVL